jgi:ribose transport system permease protein
VLVAFAEIDSFIATLAVGTFVYGVTNWYTQGQQIAGSFADGFVNVADRTFFSYVPAPAIYVAVASVVLWLVLEYLPIGRHLYALGANPRAARLVGIPTRKYIVGAFAASGFLTALGGVILASELQAGQSSLGPEFLLPAFVGALLGATSVRPGRVNVWGTLIAVLLLSIGISGLEQEGATFYVEPLFNGATLAIAVGVAGYAARRRLRARRPGPNREKDEAATEEVGAKPET